MRFAYCPYVLEVKRTFGDAATCVGPTRMTPYVTSADRNPAVQRSPAAPWCAIVYSFLKYLDPDRFRVEPLGAPQLPTTRVTARGTQTIHFCAQINMRDRVE